MCSGLGRVPSPRPRSGSHGTREGRRPRAFSVHHFFPIVSLAEMEAAKTIESRDSSTRLSPHTWNDNVYVYVHVYVLVVRVLDP